jgi:hypothetical protein
MNNKVSIIDKKYRVSMCTRNETNLQNIFCHNSLTCKKINVTASCHPKFGRIALVVARRNIKNKRQTDPMILSNSVPDTKTRMLKST